MQALDKGRRKKKADLLIQPTADSTLALVLNL